MSIETDLIRDALTLSEVMKDYGVELKSYGSRHMGKCPFHDDRLPSLSVRDDVGAWKCFAGCGQGDVISFIQQFRGCGFKEAVSEAKQLAGIEDQYLTPDQRALYELKAKRTLEEKKAFKAWRSGLINNLILYTNCQWRIYRIARRQLLRTHTDELELQADIAYNEATRKEKSLSDLESMPESDLMAWYRNRSSWEGRANPPWVLSASKLKLVENERNGAK
jgi:hypothetical protein